MTAIATWPLELVIHASTQWSGSLLHLLSTHSSLVWNNRLPLKAALPYGSLVVGMMNIHVQTVLAWGQLAGFHISPFYMEEVVAEIIDVADGGRGCIHAAHKLQHLVK